MTQPIAQCDHDYQLDEREISYATNMQTRLLATDHVVLGRTCTKCFAREDPTLVKAVSALNATERARARADGRKCIAMIHLTQVRRSPICQKNDVYSAHWLLYHNRNIPCLAPY